MDLPPLSNEQKRALINGFHVDTIKQQRPNQYLAGDPLSLMLGYFVSTTNKKIIAVQSLFGGCHYSSRNNERILSKNLLIGKEYQEDYDYFIIPVIAYGKATMTNKEMERAVGHWVFAIHDRLQNKILYLDPYGRESINAILPHVKKIILNAVNTVGPQITNLRPSFYFCKHNNQPSTDTVRCGFFGLLYSYRLIKYGIDQIYDPHLNMNVFLINVVATLKALITVNEEPTASAISDDEVQIISPVKKKNEIDKSFLPKSYQPKSPKKELSKKPKIAKPAPPPIVKISSRKGRSPKPYNPQKSDSKDGLKLKNTVSENCSSSSEQMQFEKNHDVITLDSSSGEETPFKKSKVVETPTSVFNSLSLKTPTSEKSNFNASTTPKRVNIKQIGVANKRCKGEIAEKGVDTIIGESPTVIPMEVDRQILTPKRVVISEKIETPELLFNNKEGETPATTDNEADNESSFVEIKIHKKATGIDVCVMDESLCRTVKNRYISDPRQEMTTETKGARTIMHKTVISPKKKVKNEKLLKANLNASNSGAKVEIEKIIPSKNGKASQIVLKKTVATEESESDSSAQTAPKRTGRFQKKDPKVHKGRFTKKQPSATENSETETEKGPDKKDPKKPVKIVEESTQIVIFDQLTKSQQQMPPPNVFKAYEKATGEKLKKVESPKSTNKSEKEVDMEIDKTELNNESDSSVVKNDTVKIDTVTESEMEVDESVDEETATSATESSKPKNKGGRPPKKRGRPKKKSTVKEEKITVTASECKNSDVDVTAADISATESLKHVKKAGRPKKIKNQNRYTKGTAAPKSEPEQSKWPKLTPYKANARCHIEGFKHKEGCAAYSVNHQVDYKDHGDFTHQCKHCGAWLNEYEKNTPSAANKCCNNGDLHTEELIITQNILDDLPTLLEDLCNPNNKDNKSFMKFSHLYNKLVSFGSVQTKSKLPDLPKGGPPVIRMNGDFEYAASDLFPPEGKKATFGQMYCIDLQDAEEIVSENSKKGKSKLSEEVAKKLLIMIKENHVFASLMKTASEKFAEAMSKAKEQKKELPQFKCIIVDSRDDDFKAADPNIHPHRAEKPRNELIGMIWSNDNGEPPEFKGIWLNGINGHTHFVPYWSPSVDPLCYPLLFPHGNQIYHNGIVLKKVEDEQKAKKKNVLEDDTDVSEGEVERHINGDDDDENVDENDLEEDESKKRTTKGRKFASRKQVIRYFFYQRHRIAFNQPHWLWSKGPINDAWLIDQVCRAERSSLDVARRKVEKMQKRCTTSNELKKFVEKKYLNNQKLGKMFTIPSSFKGGRKYMQNAYSDIMTIIDNTKLPSYFITFTGNPTWAEIERNKNPGETTRSDLKCRVFLTKAQEFLDDLLKRHIFGKVQAYHVVMEFQKRGMPHLHILLIMEDEITVEDVDNYISARLPECPPDDDKSPEAEQQRRYYNLVMKHMLHICNANSACQVNNKCTKGYKKNFSLTTILHTHKPPDYQRLRPEGAVSEKSSDAKKDCNSQPSSPPKKEASKYSDDDEFNGPMDFELNNKSQNSQEPIENNNFEAKDDEWEEELPFFDELRKDFDEDLSHVEYKRLQPVPEGVEVTEETKHLFGFSAKKTLRGHCEPVDDSVVVPHNKFLLLKYDCHINVECTIGQTGSPKYTCKYVTKMGDVICAKLQKVKINENGEEVIDFDEGERHLIARVMTGCEAWMRASNCWIIKQSHIVECLQIHLEGDNTKVFEPGFEGEAAEKDDKSQLLAFFALCKREESARKFTYQEIPHHYRYTNGAWVKRKITPNKFFVRVRHVAPNNTELFALRMLLMKVKGPQSFEHLRTVDGKVYPTFLQAAQKLGFWEDDELYERTLKEAFNEMRSVKQKRFFFAMVIAYSNPGNPDKMLDKFLDEIFDWPGKDLDETREKRKLKALRYLQFVFQTMGTSCRALSFALPKDFEETCTSAEFEADYDETDGGYYIDKKKVSEKEYADYLVNNRLNPEQKEAFNQIWKAIQSKSGGFFSLIGSGGVGKTFFYNSLISYCKAYGVKPLVCASTGIAATLLSGGRTAHNAFCIPKSMDSETPVNIQAQTERGELLQETDLIIIDECSMLHKNVLQYIDATMKDMKGSDQLFGGAVVLIGGDWKQLTPVVPKASDQGIIDASIKKWDMYEHCVQIELKQNMRVDPDEVDFIEELKHIGNGDTENYSNHIKGTNFIKVDPDFVVPNGLALINFCYEPQWLQEPQKYANELSGSAILSPTNAVVKSLNQRILNLLQGCQEKTFLSRNTPLGDQPLNALEDDINEYSIEKMESIETAGMPPHKLNLKTGAIVMLIKNISVSTGLCNGTRMQVTQIFDEFIKCKVLTGSRSRSENSDEIHLPRCKFEYGGTPSEPGIHFSRCQFPVKLSFSMTINKAQGQTLNRVGLYFRQGECFSHGQLYTAMSRVRAKKSIKIVTAVKDTNTVKNIVWQQLL